MDAGSSCDCDVLYTGQRPLNNLAWMILYDQAFKSTCLDTDEKAEKAESFLRLFSYI
jgi:hypothetical protein